MRFLVLSIGALAALSVSVLFFGQFSLVHAQTATPTPSPTPTPTITPSVYLTVDPDEKTYQAGQTVSLMLQINPVAATASVQSVGLRVSFTNSRLQYLSFTVPEDSLYTEAEWDDQSASPNSVGYVSFTASSTGAQDVTEATNLIQLRFKALKAGTAEVEYQFNETTSGYTIVVGDAPDTNIVDQTLTAGGTYTITAPPSNLPDAGLFDNAVVMIIVGSMLAGAGAASYVGRNKFEAQVSREF